MTSTSPFDLTATQLRRMMRAARITIRDLSGRLDIPATRIRAARRTGTITAPAAFDWRQAIAGEWTSELAEDFQRWRFTTGR